MAISLKLHNTLTRSKDAFVPIDPENVRLYVCGPTVYDYAHIGNARPIIVFDLLFRLLRHVYGREAVTYVRNITDVDDKINARAVRDYPDLPHNEAIREVTRKTEEQFHADIRALGVLMPEDVNEAGRPPRFIEPRATEHIDEMRMIIERLIARGAAYVAEEHVLFSVAAMQKLPNMPQYGAFSKRSLDELLSGARVDVAPYKRDPMDFVLWKPSGPQDPAWPSPAGIATPGRPGWHIECSAMSWKHLVQAFETRLTCADPTTREIFDIHGGGIDLVFPHHENEIAQSCCAFDTPRMANVWMHNGFLQIEGEKMSKSLGNFLTINELLHNWNGRAWAGNAARLAMLDTHYRQPINWSLSKLVQAEQELFQIASEFIFLATGAFENDPEKFSRWITSFERKVSDEFIEALSDDLNTPAALSLVRPKYHKIGTDVSAAEEVLSVFEFLGLLNVETLFLNAGPTLRGILDQEAVQFAFRLGRQLQVGMLNDDKTLVSETIDTFRKFDINVEVGGFGQVVLSRDTEKVRQQVDLINSLIQNRTVARTSKNWAESDRIRDELAAMGIVVKDNKDGTTTWEVAR